MDTKNNLSEPTTYARYARHMDAMSRAAIDPDAFARLVELRNYLAFSITEQAQTLYSEGYSYADLAAALGISRQAVAQRYPRASAPSSAPAEPGSATLPIPYDTASSE